MKKLSLCPHTDAEQQHYRHGHAPDADDSTNEQLDHETELQLSVADTVDCVSEVLLPYVVLDDTNTEENLANHLDPLVSLPQHFHLVFFHLLRQTLCNRDDQDAVDDGRNERHAHLRENTSRWKK